MATMAGKSFRIPFKIYYTDYENFDISYSCKKIKDGNKVETFAIAVRDQVPSPEILQKVKTFVKERIPQYDLDTSKDLHFTIQGQQKCKYEW